MIDPMTLSADLAFLSSVSATAPTELVLRVLDRSEHRIVIAAHDPAAIVRTRDLAIGGIRIIGGR